MSDRTKIEWTDATVNVVNGCSVVSPGCTNCYAMRLAGTRMRHHPSRQGLTVPSKAGPVWNGTVRFNKAALLLPLRWKRPRKIFWNAHGDLFHDAVPDEWIDRCFAVMALTPHHIHQVLTKRSERMREYFNDAQAVRVMKLAAEGRGLHIVKWPLRNVWLGVSVEDQQRADERIPILLDTPAAVRWLSCEPLLGPVSLASIDLDGGWNEVFPLGQEFLGRDHVDDDGRPMTRIDWVVVGGESGPGARPMHPDWARSLRDQCGAASVPFLFKQWGEFAPDTGPDEDHDRDGIMRDRIMEGAGPCAAWLGDHWQFAADGYAMPLHLPGDDHEWMYRIGKKRAGRLLDGQLHDGFPNLPLGQSTTLAETP